MNLSEIDAEILRYILQHEPVTIDNVEQAIPDFSVEYRIQSMCKMRNTGAFESAISRDTRNVQDGALTRIEYLNTYRLSDYGKKLLQDYDRSKKIYRKELWLKNAWIPIIVAFVTTLITNYMLPKLPLLIQWFASIL